MRDEQQQHDRVTMTLITKIWSVYADQVYPPQIDHRSTENHYTASLGGDDIKFYPLQSTLDI